MRLGSGIVSRLNMMWLDFTRLIPSILTQTHSDVCQSDHGWKRCSRHMSINVCKIFLLSEADGIGPSPRAGK